MLDLPIDPVLQIRGVSERTLRRTTEAATFLRETMLRQSDGPWMTLLQMLEGAKDEWAVLEALVQRAAAGKKRSAQACSLHAMN
jgi:hypothetical protein